MRKNKLSYLLFFFTLVFDQSTKYLARTQLSETQPFEIWPGHFKFQLVHNTGAFLSLGASWPEPVRISILIVFVILFLFFVWRSMVSDKSTLKQKICYAVILGGGIGNLIDRISQGEVTDFIWLGWGVLQTGVFNVADMGILFGVLALILEIHPKDNKKVV